MNFEYMTFELLTNEKYDLFHSAQRRIYMMTKTFLSIQELTNEIINREFTEKMTYRLIEIMNCKAMKTTSSHRALGVVKRRSLGSCEA